MMRHVHRLLLLSAVLGLAAFIASCAEEPCDCSPVSAGRVLNVTTASGEAVVQFTATIGFPRTDPAYNPQNPQMRSLTVSCPDGPNPEPLVCEGNALFNAFIPDDPYRSSGFPAASGDFGYMLIVEGEGEWEGLRFEGLKKSNPMATESVDVGFSGCCGGIRPRSVFTYEVEISK